MVGIDLGRVFRIRIAVFAKVKINTIFRDSLGGIFWELFMVIH